MRSTGSTFTGNRIRGGAKLAPAWREVHRLNQGLTAPEDGALCTPRRANRPSGSRTGGATLRPAMRRGRGLLSLSNVNDTRLPFASAFRRWLPRFRNGPSRLPTVVACCQRSGPSTTDASLGSQPPATRTRETRASGGFISGLRRCRSYDTQWPSLPVHSQRPSRSSKTWTDPPPPRGPHQTPVLMRTFVSDTHRTIRAQ